MTEPSSETPATEAPNFAPKFVVIVLIVAAIVLAGLWMLFKSVDADRTRDLGAWQDKLNLIAESRGVDVSKWVTENFDELQGLADNPSLQLYLTDLQAHATAKPGKKEDEDSAQRTYLRNMLVFTATRTGFSTSQQEGDHNGLAVLSSDNKIIVATGMDAPTHDAITSRASQSFTGKQALLDMQNNAAGVLYIGFEVPVFSIQGEHNANSQIGKIIGIKEADARLFNLLKHPGATEKTLETILVRQNASQQFDYLSPLADGSPPLTKHEEKTAPFLNALLVEKKDTFISDKKDYHDRVVLATARPIAGTSWSLIVKIDRQEAMADSVQRRVAKVTASILLIAVVAAITVAMWWYAHSKHSTMLSRRFREMATKSMAQEDLLRLVADHQPEAITIVDGRMNLHFANRKAAENARMSLEHIVGKSLADVRGTARASQIGEACRRVLAENRGGYEELAVQDEGVEKILRCAYVPIAHIPVESLPSPTPGVLIIEQDVSDVVRERERRLNTQHQLVETLVRLVDRRDPFAANHSLLVSRVAGEIAADMGLEPIMIETTHTAGSLMNIGKIFVPADLLTKSGSLTNDERRVIRESINAAAELVKDISFDGPVAETLREWQERWDGSGPLGLAGDNIMLPARIIAVANAFIGMISPRSWRTAMPVAAANKFLMEQSESLFDRRVVVSLMHYVEHRSDTDWLNPQAEQFGT